MDYSQYNNDLLSSNINTSFSKLRGNDLKELLNLLNTYELEYRENLMLNDFLKYGVEIEYERVIKKFVDLFINRFFWSWTSKRDNSCRSGGEVNTPICYNTKEDWIALKEICMYLNDLGAKMDGNASCHIHVDRAILESKEQNLLFLKTWACYEHIMFRFGYGDKLYARDGIKHYAYPVSHRIKTNIKEIEQGDKYSTFDHFNSKYYAINYRTGNKNTIECRVFNATTSHTIVQNNINTFANLISAPSRNMIDEEFINYKLNNEFVSELKNGYMYNEIVLKNALEFVDLIFSNNLDKVYFLVQYIKRFQDNYNVTKPIIAKRFVKEYN